MARQLKISIEPVSGTHNFFLVKVDNTTKLEGPAKKMSHEQTISDGPVKVYTQSQGIGSGAKYKVVIDLTGTNDDKTYTYELDKGFHGTTIDV